MRVIYMGTPEIAASVLEAVKQMPVEIVGVWTQPDKPVGRRQVLTPSPVKILAERYQIPVYQPRRIKRPEAVSQIKALQPDLILVTAYGQILSEEILEIPPLGCINMHASLLPKYRGAAPIQWAVANGEAETGVTAMLMDKGMDTGDILLQKAVPIEPADTAETVYDKLAAEGGVLMQEVLRALLAGEGLPRLKQADEEATYAPIIQKEDGRIDWNDSARQIKQKVQGFHAWPGAFTSLEGKKLTVLQADVIEAKRPQGAPGEILEDPQASKHKRLLVQTGKGILTITRLQLQGKKAMEADAFLRGNHVSGKRLS